MTAPSRMQIERGLSMGALGITTNPVLTYKTFNACPDYWRDRVAPSRMSWTLPRVRKRCYGSSLQMRPAAYTAFLSVPAARTDMLSASSIRSLAADFEGMLEMGRRVRTWAPNVAVKLPTTKAGVEVIEETGGARRTPMRYVELFRCAGCRCFRGVRTRREPRRRGRHRGSSLFRRSAAGAL